MEGVLTLQGCAIQVIDGNSFLLRAIGSGLWPALVVLSELVQTLILADFWWAFCTTASLHRKPKRHRSAYALKIHLEHYSLLSRQLRHMTYWYELLCLGIVQHALCLLSPTEFDDLNITRWDSLGKSYCTCFASPEFMLLWCSYYYVKSYAEGSGVIHLAAGIV